MSDLPTEGSWLGPYLLEAVIGRGGMGAVYRGRHRDTGAVHAVKLLASPAGLSIVDEDVQRFRREIELLARADDHPGVIRIHTSGQQGEAIWYAMELLPGPSLAREVQRGPLAPRRAAEVVRDVARAVAHLHGLGLLHRDLKPENIVFDGEGRPRLTDFGLAFDADLDRLTASGDAVGTPAFMAPEQISRFLPSVGEVALGPPTDVYGLGAVLYACLAGRPPFAGRDVRATLLAVLDEEPASVSAITPTTPVELDAVCALALAKDPAARYATAADLGDDLDRWLEGRPEAMRAMLPEMRRGNARTSFAIAAIAVVFVACAAAASAFVLRSDPAAERADAEKRLARAERLAKADKVAEASRELAALDRDRLGDERRRHAFALEHALAIVAAPPGAATGAERSLATAVRPSARLDEALLRRIERILLDGDRLAALHRVLHEETPVAVAAVSARALAEAIAAPGSGLAPPVDDAAFEAIVRAPALGLRTKGRLELARLLVAQPSEDALLDGFTDIHARTGVAPPGLVWSEALRERALERIHIACTVEFDEDSDEDSDERSSLAEIRRASAILRLCVGANAFDGLVSDEVAVDFARVNDEVKVQFVTGGLGVFDRERWFLAASVSEVSGWTNVHDDHYNGVAASLDAERVRALAADALAPEGSVPHAAFLTVLARVVTRATLGPFVGQRDDWLDWSITRMTDALARLPSAGPWLHYAQAEFLEHRGWLHAALEALEEALRLDRARPDAERLPVIFEAIFRIHFGHRDVDPVGGPAEPGAGGECQHIDAMVPLAKEAARIALAQRHFEIEARLKRRHRGHPIAEDLLNLAEHLDRLPSPDICPVVELAALVERLLEGYEEPESVARRERAKALRDRRGRCEHQR